MAAKEGDSATIFVETMTNCCVRISIFRAKTKVVELEL